MANLYRKKILWRDTMREPRLMMFDARLVFFLLLLAVHLALWTLFLLLVAIIAFWLVERGGYRLPSAVRAIRGTLAGTQRPAQPRGEYREPVDYGFELRTRSDGSYGGGTVTSTTDDAAVLQTRH